MTSHQSTSSIVGEDEFYGKRRQDDWIRTKRTLLGRHCWGRINIKQTHEHLTLMYAVTTLPLWPFPRTQALPRLMTDHTRSHDEMMWGASTGGVGSLVHICFCGQPLSGSALRVNLSRPTTGLVSDREREHTVSATLEGEVADLRAAQSAAQRRLQDTEDIMEARDYKSRVEQETLVRKLQADLAEVQADLAEVNTELTEVNEELTEALRAQASASPLFNSTPLLISWCVGCYCTLLDALLMTGSLARMTRFDP